MMNKYQKALDYLVSNGTHETLYSWGDEIEVETEHGEESLNLLQELVDKETPMKPTNREIYQPSKTPINVGMCQKCDWGVHEFEHYCAKCGQRIDWSEDNEL